MSFWDRIKEVELSYKHELDVIRGRRLSLGQIDSAIYSLEQYKRELASLRGLAEQERNHTAALGRLEGDLGWLQDKINRLLVTRASVGSIIEKEQRLDKMKADLNNLR